MARSVQTEPLDWTVGEDDVAAGSRQAMSAVAESLAARIRTGEPLHHLHAAVDELLDRAELVMGTSRWRTGIEIGAGSGYVSAALSRRPGVDLVYVLEPSRQLVNVAMPAMLDAAHADRSKLRPVVGSFNRLELPDGSLDFVVAFATLHHSDDLERTLGELARVLRPGGHLVALDRYQPDNLIDGELETLLDAPLDDELRAEYGFEPGVVVRRRDVGEHEHRLAEWKAALLRAGFEIFPFMGVDFSGRRAYALMGALWRALLERAGERLFLRPRRWQLLSSQVPFDVRWLVRSPKGDHAINLFLVARKREAARLDSR